MARTGTKLSERELEEIVKMHKRGIGVKKICQLYKIGHKRFYAIIDGIKEEEKAPINPARDKMIRKLDDFMMNWNLSFDEVVNVLNVGYEKMTRTFRGMYDPSPEECLEVIDRIKCIESLWRKDK